MSPDLVVYSSSSILIVLNLMELVLHLLYISHYEMENLEYFSVYSNSSMKKARS